MVLVPIGVDFALFENIERHQIQADEVHSMLIQLLVRFVLGSLVAPPKRIVTFHDSSQFSEIPLHLSQRDTHSLKNMKRLSIINIHVDNGVAILFKTSGFEFEQAVRNTMLVLFQIHAAVASRQDEIGFFFRRYPVTGNSNLEPAELRLRIASEGIHSLATQEQMLVVKQKLPAGRYLDIILRSASKHFNDVRVAVHNKAQVFFEAVHSRIGRIVDCLFKIG